MSPCRWQPDTGLRKALLGPCHPLPEHDLDAVEVGRGEDADPVADDPVGGPFQRRGLGGHPPVPLRPKPRKATSHRGVLGTRLISNLTLVICYC